MAWPWVSRVRLEEAERRLEEANAERRRLLDLLLEGSAERARTREMALRAEVDAMGTEPDGGAPPPGGSPVLNFSTPFDRLEKRFDQAHAGGRIDKRFKARV